MSGRTPSISTALDLWLSICARRHLPNQGVDAQWSTLLEELSQPYRQYHTLDRLETLCLLFQTVQYPDALFPSSTTATTAATTTTVGGQRAAGVVVGNKKGDGGVTVVGGGGSFGPGGGSGWSPSTTMTSVTSGMGGTLTNTTSMGGTFSGGGSLGNNILSMPPLRGGASTSTAGAATKPGRQQLQEPAVGLPSSSSSPPPIISYGVVKSGLNIVWGPASGRLAFPDELAFALFFHNIEYNPLDENDSITRSLQHFKRFSTTYHEHFPADFVERVVFFVNKTRNFVLLPKQPPPRSEPPPKQKQREQGGSDGRSFQTHAEDDEPTMESDTRWLLDILHCIFASSREEYANYAHCVEKEMMQYHIHMEAARILKDTQMAAAAAARRKSAQRNSIIPSSHRPSLASPSPLVSTFSAGARSNSPAVTLNSSIGGGGMLNNSMSLSYGRKRTLTTTTFVGGGGSGGPFSNFDERGLVAKQAAKESALMGEFCNFNVPSGPTMMSRRRYVAWRSKFLRKILGGHVAAVLTSGISLEDAGVLKPSAAVSSVPLLPPGFIHQWKKTNGDGSNDVEGSSSETAAREDRGNRFLLPSIRNLSTRKASIASSNSLLSAKDVDFLGGSHLLATPVFATVRRIQIAMANIRWELSLLTSPETRNERMTISDKQDFMNFEKKHRENVLLRLLPDQVRHILAMGMDLCFSCQDRDEGNLIACILGTTTDDARYSIEARSEHCFGGSHLLIHVALVHEDHRQSGIMTHMMREYIHGVRERHTDVEKISLICPKPVVQFFERLGFEVVRTAIIRAEGTGELEEDLVGNEEVVGSGGREHYESGGVDDSNPLSRLTSPSSDRGGRGSASPPPGTIGVSNPAGTDLGGPRSSSHQQPHRASPVFSDGESEPRQQQQQQSARNSKKPSNVPLFNRSAKPKKKSAVETELQVSEMVLDLTTMDDVM